MLSNVNMPLMRGLAFVVLLFACNIHVGEAASDSAGETSSSSSSSSTGSTGAPASCGDGALDPGEECDNGQFNADSGYCTTACKLAACGDGIKNGAESCDYADPAGSSCTMECKLVSCGNAIVERGEECDDGNADDTDACLASCMAATCGDGAVQAGVEECDDGNAEDGDSCLTSCVSAKCGDGVVHEGDEACDDGAENGAYGKCSATCAGPGEYCGDGAQNGPETCDDGAENGAYDMCAADCSGPGDFCGDGVKNGPEACDDANTSNNDDCLKSCKAAMCGDGILWNEGNGGEECDAGAKPDNTVCDDASCKIVGCDEFWANCDKNYASNGCEADLSLSGNCGACGVTCSMGKSCTFNGGKYGCN